MLTVDRDKLISAAYSATMSPDSFDESLDTLDALIFTSQPLSGNASYFQKNSNVAHKHIVDAELLNHFKRAHEIQLLLGRSKAEKTNVQVLLDATPNPAFIFDREENIVALNDLATNTVNKNRPTLADCCDDMDVLANIRQYIAKAGKQPMLVETGYSNTHRDMNTCLLVIRLNQTTDAELGFTRGPDKELYFLTIVNLGFDQSKTDLFQKSYGLTKAEVRIAVLLASGKQLPEIASIHGSTVTTIRTHIKRIKKKTQSRDVPAIVRLLCGFSAGTLISSQLSHADMSVTGDTSALRSKKQIRLRDGRRMDYLEQGNPEGSPVVMFHNMPYSVELPDRALKAAARMNLRILTPYRPGYGDSDLLQGAYGDALLDGVAADVYELLGHLGVSKATVVGQTIGSIYALRFARLYPNRVSNLFAVSYTPNWKDEWMAQMPKRQKFILRITKHMPQLLPLVTRAAVVAMDKGHSVKLIHSLCKESASDIKALNNSEIVQLMTRGCEQGLKQGAEAFRRDCFLAIRDFTEEAKLLKHSFHVIHGDDDQIINVTRVKTFVEDVPGSKLEIINGAGQLLMYSHWEHVFKAIIKKQKNCK